MAANRNQLQNLGNGTYRVVGARVSPISGRYVVQAREGAGRSVSRSVITGRFVTRRADDSVQNRQGSSSDKKL